MTKLNLKCFIINKVLYLRNKFLKLKQEITLFNIIRTLRIKIYINELRKLKTLETIILKEKEFENNIKGMTYRGQLLDFGGLGIQESKILYALIRSKKPEIVVETGVCNGVSSTIILQALHENDKGKLISIDFPEVEGMIYEDGTFWEGKGGAAIPKNKQPGWIIPDHLRYRWEIHLGKSQDILPKIVSQLPKIDLFIHDSEHSYQCMIFEYRTVYPKIVKGGILLSDDVNWNNAFGDFINENGIKTKKIFNQLGIIVK